MTVDEAMQHIQGFNGRVEARLETTLPPMTLTADTEKALRTAGRKVAEWTAERDRLVRVGVAEGGSYREVGSVVGLSHTAVKFIAHGRPAKT